MPTTVGDIVNAVINELSQVPGIATQIYASGRIQQHVQNAYMLEFEEMWWPQLMHYWVVGIDPDTGNPTSDLIGDRGNAEDYTDINAVWLEGRHKPVTEFPRGLNPFTITASPGRFIGPSDITNRPFGLYPHGYSGNVTVWGRQRPKLPLDVTDKVYIDQLLLQYDACWMYAVDDGTIPAQVNKFQVLAQNRRRMVKASYSQHPLALDPRYDEQEHMGDSYFTVDKHPLA